MKTPLLDTNTLIRFITGEPEVQAREVAKLVASAEAGKVRLCVLPMVLAEAVFVLTGFYKHPRAKVAAALSHLIGCPGFQSPEQDRMIHALKLFGANKIDFVDCYLAAVSILDQVTVVSFDRDFDKLHGVTRKTPAAMAKPEPSKNSTSTPTQFSHEFTNGSFCTFIFDRTKHYDPATKLISPAKHWDRAPTETDAEALFPEYREWSHIVHCEIADLLESDCVYVLQDSSATPPFWEFWVYHPGGSKECVKSGTGRFDPRMIGRDDWPL